MSDVNRALLDPSTRTEHSPSRGEARYYHVDAGDRRVEDAAWSYPDSPIEELRDTIRFEWEAMDAWFEEDEEVFVHPRTPTRPVASLPSSPPAEAFAEGQAAPASPQPPLRSETGLPRRYYLPQSD